MSFKLETDPGLLRLKAEGALRRYGVHAVVANELGTRRDAVAVMSARDDDDESTEESDIKVVGIRRGEDGGDIEKLLVAELVKRHQQHVLSKTSAPRSLYYALVQQIAATF